MKVAQLRDSVQLILTKVLPRTEKILFPPVMLPTIHKGRLNRTPGENSATGIKVSDFHCNSHFGKLHGEMVAGRELDFKLSN